MSVNFEISIIARDPIVDISKFMSMCDKSRHTGLGLGMALTD